jgi:hypothetical protein
MLLGEPSLKAMDTEMNFDKSDSHIKIIDIKPDGSLVYQPISDLHEVGCCSDCTFGKILLVLLLIVSILLLIGGVSYGIYELQS